MAALVVLLVLVTVTVTLARDDSAPVATRASATPSLPTVSSTPGVTPTPTTTPTLPPAGQASPSAAPTGSSTAEPVVLPPKKPTSARQDASGQRPPGSVPGWRQTYAEEFATNAAASKFAATYAKSWCGYADGTGGKYFTSAVSASGGSMVITLDGKKGAAGSFGPPSTCWGKTYGRYSIRFKAEEAAGNGAAMMLWPSSNVWGDGEIDFPEGNFDTSIHLFHHPMNCTDCSSSDNLDTGVRFTSWHTATTEWTKGQVRYYLDGKRLKTITHDVPTTPHRMTIQAAPNAGKVRPGRLLIAWVAQWDRA